MMQIDGTRPRRPWSCALLVILALLVAPRCPAQDADAFASATAAFQTGDFERALALFEAALAGGVDSPALHYNLGVSQYRVGAYAESAATFSRVRARFPALAAIAEYNRGLALLALEDRSAARVAFERARREGDTALSALAASALAALGPAATSPPRWLGYFDLAAGHDDNVALIDELALPTSVSAASQFTEVLGYAGRRFDSAPLRLGVSGYVVRYADASTFDQAAVRIDTAFEWTAGEWRLEAGPQLARTELDGDGFEHALGVTVRAARPIAERLIFDARFVYDDLEAPSNRFDYVTGTRQRLRLGLDSRGDRHRLRVGYEIEANDRASASVSPERRRLVANVTRRIGVRWSLEATLARRQSDYDDLAPRREERLTEVAAAARRSLPQGWLLSTEYRAADNDSNVPQFSYRSDRFSVGLGKSL